MEIHIEFHYLGIEHFFHFIRLSSVIEVYRIFVRVSPDGSSDDGRPSPRRSMSRRRPADQPRFAVPMDESAVDSFTYQSVVAAQAPPGGGDAQYEDSYDSYDPAAYFLQSTSLQMPDNNNSQTVVEEQVVYTQQEGDYASVEAYVDEQPQSPGQQQRQQQLGGSLNNDLQVSESENEVNDDDDDDDDDEGFDFNEFFQG